jgi:multicomponent Na+:H+ antiporter subunit D
LCTGIVLHRLGSVNETWLHGRGRHLRVTGVVFTLAALGLADLPPFATYLGKGWIEDTSAAAGSAWVAGVLIACSILVGGAVLRVAGGVFWGLGDPPAEDPQMAEQASEEKSETDEGRQHTPLTMIVPPAVLVAGAVALGLLPHLGSAVQDIAVRFQDQAAYNQAVLFGRAVAHPVALHASESTAITPADVLTGTGSALGALILAGLSLYRRRIPLLRRGPESDLFLVEPIRRFQSGVVNDYVTWIVVGVACIGGYLAAATR